MATVPLTKRAMIDKTNASIVIMVSVAAFVSVFSLVATKTLFSQFMYQGRVLTEKNAAVDQLEENVANIKDLKVSYDAFTGSTTNMLNGNSNGVGPQDGNNAKLVLDALPSYYDFPATVTSLQILSANNGTLSGITGIDNEVQEAANRLASNPSPIQIPFNLSATGSYQQIQGLVGAFEHSIRPVDINKMDITGTSESQLVVTVNGVTYYQPGKSLTMKTKVVE